MLEELFSTWVGQLSLLVIVIVIGMAVYMYRMAMRNIEADARASAELPGATAESGGTA